MVFGLVMMSAMVPTMIGLNEATKGTRDHEESRKAESRNTRSHLVATCDVDEGSQAHREQVHNARIYLGQDQKLYITKQPSSSMSPFNGHLYSHPSYETNNTAGLISMSGEDKPLARWVFVDSVTNEMRWGGRQDSEGHICGRFDLTVDEQYITLEDSQRWLAVGLPEEYHHAEDNAALVWGLYFDGSDDGGAGLPIGTQKMTIYLKRDPADS